MKIERARREDAERLVEMRLALWPHAARREHEDEVMEYLQDGSAAVAFLARDGSTCMGFAEASLRHEYVNGCDTSPVAFLEGIFVEPPYRRAGVARALSEAVARWGTEHGCAEMASDADWENPQGIAWHIASGFDETERVIFYRRLLTPRSA